MRVEARTVVVPLACPACHQRMQIMCTHVGGFADRRFYRIVCPYCGDVKHPQLPGDVIDVLKAVESH